MTDRLARIVAVLTVAPAALAAPMMKQLADNVYMMSEGHYVSLVVVGEDGVLITDPSFTPRTASMKKAIAEITDKPVTGIVLSHEHYDHVGGTEVFPGAQAICHVTCESVFALERAGAGEGGCDVRGLHDGGLSRSDGEASPLRSG